jgi:hypothetical protein
MEVVLHRGVTLEFTHCHVHVPPNIHLKIHYQALALILPIPPSKLADVAIFFTQQICTNRKRVFPANNCIICKDPQLYTPSPLLPIVLISYISLHIPSKARTRSPVFPSAAMPSRRKTEETPCQSRFHCSRFGYILPRPVTKPSTLFLVIHTQCSSSMEDLEFA